MKTETAVVYEAILKYCRSLSPAAIQSSRGEERIYYAGLSVSDLVSAVVDALRPAQCALASNATTISCSGKDITIACDDHDTKQAVMDALTSGVATEPAKLACQIVTEWLGMFDPPPQIDFQQSEFLQGAIARVIKSAPPAQPGGEPVAYLRDIAHAHGVATVIASEGELFAYPVYRVAPLADEAGMREAAQELAQKLTPHGLKLGGIAAFGQGRLVDPVDLIFAALRPSQAAAVLPERDDIIQIVAEAMDNKADSATYGYQGAIELDDESAQAAADAIRALARPPELENEVIERCAKVADRGADEMAALQDHELVREHDGHRLAASIGAGAIREVATAIRALRQEG